MAYLETRIIDLKEEEKNELCKLIVSSISGDDEMRNIIMMYIEMNMITIKEKRSPPFEEESVINKKGRLLFSWTYTKNSIKIKKKTQSSTETVDICVGYYRKQSYKSNQKFWIHSSISHPSTNILLVQ